MLQKEVKLVHKFCSQSSKNTFLTEERCLINYILSRCTKATNKFTNTNVVDIVSCVVDEGVVPWFPGDVGSLCVDCLGALLLPEWGGMEPGFDDVTKELSVVILVVRGGPVLEVLLVPVVRLCPVADGTVEHKTQTKSSMRKVDFILK